MTCNLHLKADLFEIACGSRKIAHGGTFQLGVRLIGNAFSPLASRKMPLEFEKSKLYEGKKMSISGFLVWQLLKENTHQIRSIVLDRRSFVSFDFAMEWQGWSVNRVYTSLPLQQTFGNGSGDAW